MYLYHHILTTAPKRFNIGQTDNFNQEKRKPFKKRTKGSFIQTMDTNVNYFYDAKFEGNISIVGQTGCGKTTFVQSLAKNKMLGNMKEIYWLPIISLSKDRENNISDCFDVEVHFKYPKDLEEFDNLLDFFQRQKEKNNCNNNLMDKNTLLDRLIVMNDVSRVADKSGNFDSFLTVSKKFRFTYVYIFHTIYLRRNNWHC